jgi:hypothetical protein
MSLTVTTESKEHILLEVGTQLPLRCFDVLSELCLKHDCFMHITMNLFRTMITCKCHPPSPDAPPPSTADFE